MMMKQKRNKRLAALGLTLACCAVSCYGAAKPRYVFECLHGKRGTEREQLEKFLPYGVRESHRPKECENYQLYVWQEQKSSQGRANYTNGQMTLDLEIHDDYRTSYQTRIDEKCSDDPNFRTRYTRNKNRYDLPRKGTPKATKPFVPKGALVQIQSDNARVREIDDVINNITSTIEKEETDARTRSMIVYTKNGAAGSNDPLAGYTHSERKSWLYPKGEPKHRETRPKTKRMSTKELKKKMDEIPTPKWLREMGTNHDIAAGFDWREGVMANLDWKEVNGHTKGFADGAYKCYLAPAGGPAGDTFYAVFLNSPPFQMEPGDLKYTDVNELDYDKDDNSLTVTFRNPIDLNDGIGLRLDWEFDLSCGKTFGPFKIKNLLRQLVHKAKPTKISIPKCIRNI